MSVCDQLLIIRNNELFSQITNEEYEELQLVHHFKETPRNQYIYFESHLRNALFFLKEGFVKIGYFDKDGNEVIKDILGPGDVFGQLTLLPNNIEGEFAQAHKSDVSLCMFKLADFEKLLAAKPSISVKFTRQVGLKMARLESRMVNLLQRDVKVRLLYFLFNLTRQFPQHLQGNSFDMLNILTHDDVARLIASSRQTVTTFINQLEQEGLIVFSRQRLYFPDVKKMQNRLSVG